MALNGLGGKKTFVIHSGDQVVIAGFGAIGAGNHPPSATFDELDALRFVGPGLVGRNMLLRQEGADVVITFAGDPATNVTLQGIRIDQLDNLTVSGKAIGNFIFDGQSKVVDDLDIVAANAHPTHLTAFDHVTFLNDLANNLRGRNASNDVINAQGGADTVSGGSGEDLIRGGDGNDRLTGDQGNDTLVGGSGNDWLAGDGGDVDDDGFEKDDENRNSGADSLRGGDGSDTLQGNGGNDHLAGDNGKDCLQGQDGNDTLTGDQGDDTAGGRNGQRHAGGRNGNHNLSGGTGADKLAGDDGDDRLQGNGGDDTLAGGTGGDELIGGAGDDSLDGGADTDAAVFAGKIADYAIATSGGIATVADLKPTVDGNDGTDTLVAIEQLQFADGAVTIPPGLSSIDLATLTAAQGSVFYGQTGEQVGRSVSSAGDVNGDGFDDVIFGARAPAVATAT